MSTPDLYFFKESKREEYDPLSSEEIDRLIKIVQSNYDYENKRYLNEEAIIAKDLILKANLRLPSVVVKRLELRPDIVDDCREECYVSFEKSILTYKFGEGASFATYAVSSARYHLLTYLSNERNTVRLSLSQMAKRKEKGENSSPMCSLDAENENGWKMVVPHYETAFKIMAKKELSTLIRQSLSCLSDREEKIISARYLSESQTTVRELSEIIGVSKSRIQQIEQRAIWKIRKFIKSRT